MFVSFQIDVMKYLELADSAAVRQRYIYLNNLWYLSSLSAIGTSCRALQSDKIVHCIDALGTTALGLPSATTGLIPSATPVPGSEPDIVYSPPNAWTISESDSNCTTSKSLHVTDTINATVSFDFTGKASNIEIKCQYDWSSIFKARVLWSAQWRLRTEVFFQCGSTVLTPPPILTPLPNMEITHFPSAIHCSFLHFWSLLPDLRPIPITPWCWYTLALQQVHQTALAVMFSSTHSLYLIPDHLSKWSTATVLMVDKISPFYCCVFLSRYLFLSCSRIVIYRLDLESGVLFQFTSEFYQEKKNTMRLNVIDASSKGERQNFLIAEGWSNIWRQWGPLTQKSCFPCVKPRSYHVVEDKNMAPPSHRYRCDPIFWIHCYTWGFLWRYWRIDLKSTALNKGLVEWLYSGHK